MKQTPKDPNNIKPKTKGKNAAQETKKVKFGTRQFIFKIDGNEIVSVELRSFLKKKVYDPKRLPPDFKSRIDGLKPEDATSLLDLLED